MKQYVVSYSIPDHEEHTIEVFRCQADDDAHAVEQLTNAEPKSQVERVGVLPPDPDGMNERRAGWAVVALYGFASVTGCDPDGEAPGDLIADLIHWCDRNGQDFGRVLAHAVYHYRCETSLDENTVEPSCNFTSADYVASFLAEREDGEQPEAWEAYVAKIREECGGKEHPRYQRGDWQYEVGSGDTSRGYWDWVAASIEHDEA